MIKKKISFYEILVFIAYGFFILLGLTWFSLSFFSSGHFNYEAFSIIVIFGAQVYYRHKLTNLILGILALGFSIFMFLEVLESYDLFAKNAAFDTGSKALIGIAAFSIAMSIILIFGYTKLSFKDI